MTRARGIFLTSLLSIVFCAPVAAGPFSDFRLEKRGLKAGIALANLQGEATEEIEAGIRAGIQLGGFLCFHVNNNLAIQPELLLTWKGDKRDFTEPVFRGEAEFSETISLTYLEAPVLAVFPVPTDGNIKPSLFTGPSIALNLAGKIKGEYDIRRFQGSRSGSYDSDLGNIQTFELGGVIGASLEIPGRTSNIGMDIRYTFGLNHTFDDVDMAEVYEGADVPIVDPYSGKAEDLKNGVFSITIGLSFH